MYIRRNMSLGRREMALQLLLPKFLKSLLYRLKGYQIDKEAILGFGSGV